MNKLLKKIVSLTAVCAMSASFAVGAYAEDFTDMPSDWRTTAIENAVKNGLISGMGDGTVAPDANITRAQMAAIIVRALGATEEADISKFVDISVDKWYYKELAKAVYMKAFAGDGDKMNPENNITFQECFTVLSNVFNLWYRTTDEETELELAKYVDGAEVAAWAKKYYASVLENGYWTGGPDNLLKPTAYITRGEFAVVMDNMIKTYITDAGEVGELPEGNVLVRGSGAVFNGTSIKGDLIIGDGVPAEGITLDNINVDGRLVFRGCASPGMVEKTDADGNTKEIISYTKVGAVPTGYAFDLQVIAPYIDLSLTGITVKKLYTIKDTHITLPNAGGAPSKPAPAEATENK